MIEKSRRDSQAVKGVLIATAVLLAMIGFTIYRLFDIGYFSRIRLEIYAELVLSGLLILRCYPTYEYRLTPKSLQISRYGLLGKKEYEVFYKDVFELYRYKAQLGGSITKFRRTFRVNSALDSRNVWVLAYTFAKKKGSENRRLYMKMDDEFLFALNKKLPAKVRIPE